MERRKSSDDCVEARVPVVEIAFEKLKIADLDFPALFPRGEARGKLGPD